MMNKKQKSSDSDPYTLQKKIKSMHIKLDYLKKKFNESLASNDQLKEQINHLRREKNIFNNIYNELKHELNDKKEQLKKVLQQSKNAKQEIEKGQDRLEKYKMEADIEKKKFEKEFESVYQGESQIENKDEKFKEKYTMNLKFQQSQQENSRYPSSVFQISQSILNILNQIKFDRSNCELENFKMMQSGGNGMSQIQNKEKSKKNQEKENIYLESLKSEVAQYEEIFKKLMEETGTKDISKIVKTFVDYETENYSLFKYINTLRDDTETLMQQKKCLQTQIDMYKNKPQQYKEEPKTIKFMELKLFPLIVMYLKNQKELETIESQKRQIQKET